MSPRSSTMILKPPAVPRPSIGGAPSTLTSPSLISCLELGLQRGGDGLAGKARGGAAVEVVEHHVHRAEVRGVGAQQDRLAGDGHGVLHAGVLVGQLLDAVHHPLGPLHGGRVGQLHVHQQVALVLRGDEARGRLHEPPPGQRQQAAVDHQHQHADAQQPAHRAGVDVGRVVEADVEQRGRAGRGCGSAAGGRSRPPAPRRRPRPAGTAPGRGQAPAVPRAATRGQRAGPGIRSPASRPAAGKTTGGSTSSYCAFRPAAAAGWPPGPG